MSQQMGQPEQPQKQGTNWLVVLIVVFFGYQAITNTIQNGGMAGMLVQQSSVNREVAGVSGQMEAALAAISGMNVKMDKVGSIVGNLASIVDGLSSEVGTLTRSVSNTEMRIGALEGRMAGVEQGLAVLTGGMVSSPTPIPTNEMPTDQLQPNVQYVEGNTSTVGGFLGSIFGGN